MCWAIIRAKIRKFALWKTKMASFGPCPPTRPLFCSKYQSAKWSYLSNLDPGHNRNLLFHCFSTIFTVFFSILNLKIIILLKITTLSSNKSRAFRELSSWHSVLTNKIFSWDSLIMIKSDSFIAKWKNLYDRIKYGFDFQMNDNEFDGRIFSLDFHIFGLWWTFPKINFTDWISIEISIRLSQKILSDDLITHSSHKTRIRSRFPASPSLNIQRKIQIILNNTNLTTMWLGLNDPVDLFWPRNFK